MAPINIQVDETVFDTLIKCTGILVVKVFCTNVLPVIPSIKFGSRAPEDHKAIHMLTGSGDSSPELDAKTKEKLERDIERYKRIIMNDLENIPIGLIALWAAGMATPNSKEVAFWASVFTGCRVAHSICYANGVLFPRAAMHWTGFGCTLRVVFLAVTAPSVSSK